MKLSFALRSGKIPAVILACMLFAACSTTQKGSARTGTQEAAPISEAAKTETGAASSPSATSASTTSSDSAAVAGSDASTGTGQSAAPAPGDAEAARLKQQLADQETEINRLRDEQVNAQRLADEEAARQRAGETGAAAGTASQEQQQAGAASQEQQQAGTASQEQQQAGATSQSTGDAAAGEVSPGPAAGDSAQGAGDQPVAGQPLQRSIYFRYDDATIGDEYDSVLIAHAAFLKANPDYEAEVQGNCDERGSREYNLALGARRAEAVKRALELAGVDGARVKTVSYGAEKPVAFGQDEESYKKNRRADILY